MRIGYLAVTAAVLISAIAGQTAAQDANALRVELLWPNGAPGAKGDTDYDKPTLTIFLPPKEKASGTAVVILPGGAYAACAMDHEGYQVGRWLNSIGVAGFVVNYRHHGKGYIHPAPIQDAQRAIQTVRARAKEFNLDPNKIGIMGFSAGGHLASTATTLFDKSFAPAGDEIDKVSRRPDFSILIYAVISLRPPYTHGGSVHNLLGPDPNDKMLDLLSSHLQVTAKTPPTFLLNCTDDPAVPPENSIIFYEALRKNNVQAEMHLYRRGSHGFGLGHPGVPVSTWPMICEKWMSDLGFCPPK